MRELDERRRERSQRVKSEVKIGRPKGEKIRGERKEGRGRERGKSGERGKRE